MDTLAIDSITANDSLTVDTLVDENDGDFSAGDVSLREAIILSKDGGNIKFSPSLTGGTITLTQGELVIDKGLTIKGLGADKLTISGNSASRVFKIADGQNSDSKVAIDGLTIADGFVDGSNGDRYGAGISNEESLKLTNAVIRDNRAAFGSGGIDNRGNLYIDNSTINNNFAEFGGGGIGSGDIEGRGVILTLINTTISGNRTNGEGGGISNGATSRLIVNSSTIYQNTAALGGGVSGNAMTINNTIIAGNLDNDSSNGNQPDVVGNFTTTHSNLIGDGTGSTGFTNGVDGNQVGNSITPIDPKLSFLQNNGGSTLTHALLDGSPAIDAANPNANVSVDQREVARPQGNGYDIGAFEATPADSTVPETLVNAQDFKAGIQAGLGELSTLLSSDLAGASLPILGNLGDRYVPEFLKTLNSSLVSGMDAPEMVLNDFVNQLKKNLPGVNVVVDKGSQQTEITLSKADNQTKPVSLDSNLGIPLLNLSSSGQASAKLMGDMKLTFGFSKDYGFYINTNPSKTHFEADLNAKLSQDFAAKGTLGFLQMDLTNRSDTSTGVDANFNAVLHDLDNAPNSGNDGDRLTLSELRQSNYSLRDLFSSDFSITPKLGLKGKTSVLGKDGLPSLNLDLDLNWNAFKYSNGQATKGNPNLAFNNVKLDMGGFISNFAKPVFNQINNVISPFRPIIKVLNADTKIFSKLHLTGYFDENHDDKVSLFEVGSKLNQLVGGNKFDKRFLDGITALDEASQALVKIGNTADNITVDLGSHSVGQVNTDTSPVALQQQPLALAKSGSAQASQDPAVSTFFNALKKVEGLGFPILSDPTQAVNLLLGKEANLFRYDMPDLNIDFQIDKSFPIFWPLEGNLGGGFKATSNLEFGYDTYGLSQWQKTGYSSSGATNLTDGFYVVDQPGDELNLSAQIKAGFGVDLGVAKGEIIGGIKGEAGIDLVDMGENTPNPNWQSEYQKTSQKLQQEYQKNLQANLTKPGTFGIKAGLSLLKSVSDPQIRQDLANRGVSLNENHSDGKLRTSEITSRLSTPLDLFDISGRVSVFLDGYASLGVWPLKKEWNVNLATFEIANFKTGGGTHSGITSNKYIAGATIFLDANFNGTLDDDEPLTYSNFDGSYNLNFATEKLDKNGNGQIDSDEGQWVSQGGFDTFTQQDIDVPLTAPGGYSMITPVTTVVNSLVQQGVNSNQAEIEVKQALSLPNATQLSSFDPIAAMKQGDPNGKKVMTAHVEMNTLLDQTTSFMQGAFQLSPTQISSVIGATMADQINTGKLLDLTNAAQVENLVKSASVVLQSIEPSQKWENVLNIADKAAKVMASSAQEMKDSLKIPGSATQALERVSKLQAFLVSQTSQDLQSAAAGTKSIAKVLKENTGKGLIAALKKQEAQEKAQQNALKIGTRHADILKGSKNADLIIGQQGNDHLYGQGKQDILSGDQGNDWLEGGTGNDTLNGGDGKDTLLGGNGNDLLIGEKGNDILIGGKGNDRFRVNLEMPGIDRMNDFSKKSDSLEISVSQSIEALTIDSSIGADQFRLGSKAMDASDRFIYNRSTGALFFDSDGKGGSAQVQIATLSNRASLDYSNIAVVA